MLALINSIGSEVEVPGVYTAAIPASIKAGISSSGITPPPLLVYRQHLVL